MNTTSKTPLTQEILSKNIWRLMAKFSLPAIIAMSINSLNTFVDALFIGQYVGQDALAAVSLAFPLTMITNGLAAMIGVGGSSLLSRVIGSGEEDIQKKVFGTVSILSLVSSIILTVLGLYFAKDLIRLMGGTGEIMEMGAYYYQILLLSSFFRIYSVALNMLIRAEGKIKEAMIYSIMAALLNIFLNPLFIAYFGWGIAGAAWATNASMVLYNIVGFIYFFKRKTNYPVDLNYWKMNKTLLRPILSVGVSAMMLQIMFFVQQVFVFRSIVHYGSVWHIAFMGACYRIMILMIMPTFGFSQAMQPVIGINFGAEIYNRVKKAFTIFTSASTLLLIAIWVFLMIFPEVILGWMLPDATFSVDDIFNFRVLMSTYPLFPFFFMANTLFQSIGNAKIAGLMLLARELALFVPIVLVLPLLFGVNGIYYAVAPVNFIVFVAAIFLVKREFVKWV